MNKRIAALSIIVAGILGISIVAALPFALRVTASPIASPGQFGSDHSLFDTQPLPTIADDYVNCTSTKDFILQASVTNFDSVTHTVIVRFMGGGATLATADLVAYFIPAHQSLTISGFGKGGTPSDESSIIRVDPIGANTANPLVGWVSIWSQGTPSCSTITGTPGTPPFT